MDHCSMAMFLQFFHPIHPRVEQGQLQHPLWLLVVVDCGKKYIRWFVFHFPFLATNAIATLVADKGVPPPADISKPATARRSLEQEQQQHHRRLWFYMHSTRYKTISFVYFIRSPASFCCWATISSPRRRSVYVQLLTLGPSGGRSSSPCVSLLTNNIQQAPPSLNLWGTKNQKITCLWNGSTISQHQT